MASLSPRACPPVAGESGRARPGGAVARVAGTSDTDGGAAAPVPGRGRADAVAQPARAL